MRAEYCEARNIFFYNNVCWPQHTLHFAEYPLRVVVLILGIDWVAALAEVRVNVRRAIGLNSLQDKKQRDLSACSGALSDHATFPAPIFSCHRSMNSTVILLAGTALRLHWRVVHHRHLCSHLHSVEYSTKYTTLASSQISHSLAFFPPLHNLTMCLRPSLRI